MKTSGFDESADEVQAYGLAVADAAKAAGVALVLCDERALDYRIPMGDSFELAKLIAGATRGATRVGIVCAPQHFAAGDFWASVAANRGMKVRIFTEMDAGTTWVRTGDGPVLGPR